MQTFWQWWSDLRFGHHTGVRRMPGERLDDVCPPLRTRNEAGIQYEDGHIDWSDVSKPIVLHCWDVFCCHWPQILVAALFGRP